MEKDTVKENLHKYISKPRDEISLRIKNEFVSFLNDLLQVFPNNSKLFICRIITHQIEKEEICMMLEDELLNLTTKESAFNVNFLNYENKFITNDMTFKLNDLYNIKNKDNCNELECIYNWIDVLVFLLKQLKTTK